MGQIGTGITALYTTWDALAYFDAYSHVLYEYGPTSYSDMLKERYSTRVGGGN